MAEQLDDLGHVEQELQRLRERLDASFAAISDLLTIQSQFEELARERNRISEFFDRLQAEWHTIQEQHRGTRELLEGMEMAIYRVAETETSLVNRFTALEPENASLWSELQEAVQHAVRTPDQRFDQYCTDIQGELHRVQNNLHAAHRNLRTEVGNQINDLKGEIEQGEIEQRIAAQRGEWATHQQAVLARLDELQRALRSETETLTDLVHTTHANTDRQIESLATRVQAVEAAVERLHGRAQVTERLIAIAVALTVLATALSIWAFMAPV